MNKFDKPFRILPTFDQKKSIELFNLVSKLDTHEILQFSLINQVPLDVINGLGDSLIHEVINIDSKKASEHAKLNVIKFLVLNNVNPDRPNQNNQTPLHHACSLQLSLIVNYLLELRVDVNYKDNLGNTPFHYLLTGKIKTIDNTSEVLDFVPPPKKVDTKLRDQTIALKKEIWKMIENNTTTVTTPGGTSSITSPTTTIIKDNLPMLESIKKTIDNILIEEPEISNKQIETKNLIVKLALDTSSENKLSEIKQNVESSRKFITDKIKDIMGNLSDLENIKIHQRDETSWSPINTTEGLITGGKIKKVIKNEIIKQKENADTLIKDFSKIASIPDNWDQNQWDDIIIKHYFNAIGLTKFQQVNGPRNDNYNYNGILQPGTANRLHNKFKHPQALDYASSIIDFNKLKYVGGPRDVTIANPTSFITELSDLLDPTKFQDESQQILYSLGSPLQQITINGLGPDYDLLTNIITFEALGDFTINTNWYPSTVNPATGNQIADMKFFVILAYIAIMRPYEFNQIPLINAGTLVFRTNPFAQKWYSSYESNQNIGNWLICMWCDLMCKFSNSNLDCSIPFRLLALASGLNNYQTSKIQGIGNVYKQQIVNQIIGSGESDQIKISKWILLLLNDSVDKTFIDAISNTGLNIDTLVVNNQNLKSLGKLVLNYISNPSAFNPNNTTEEGKFYLSYAKSSDSKDNLCKIMLELYRDLKNQPLKQTVLDTIYWFKMIDSLNISGSVTNFKFINTDELFNELTRISTTIDGSSNLSPSSYSFINYLGPVTVSAMAQNHFRMAHTIGLYYEGLFEPVNYTFTDYISFSSNRTDYNISFTKINTGTNVPFLNHKLEFNVTIKDNLAAGNIELPLGFISLDGAASAPASAAGLNDGVLTPITKYFYYNTFNRPFISPTIHSYAHMLLKKIAVCQTNIELLVKRANGIIGEVIGSKTTGLKELYTKIYYQIVFNSKMLSSFINSFQDFSKLMEKESNDLWKDLNFSQNKSYKQIKNYPYVGLARSLNKLNASYYLYYYIYSPNKLVNLSRFNYYQIPINNPVKFEYFDGTGTTGSKLLVDIMKEQDPTNIAGTPETVLASSSRGLINQFTLGTYNSILTEYMANILPSKNITTLTDFNSNKNSKVPPSLLDHMSDFYKYTLIELIERVLEDIETNKITTSSIQKDIWTKAESIIKSRGLSIKDTDLSVFQFIAKLIQELIKEQIDVYITNTTAMKFQEYIKGLPSTIKLPDTLIFKTKGMDVKLASTSIDVTGISAVNDVKNMYSMVITPNKNKDIFVLYPNDLTNINKLRSKYGVEVNKDIIRLMFKYGASPLINSNEGTTPIYPIIKNYNWVVVEVLKNDFGIDFRDFYGELPVKFIQRENLNNLNKVIGTYEILSDPIKKLFTNIDGYLFDDVKTLILSNESFGNNILSNLSDSFNLSTYLTFQLLSENLMNIGSNFSIDDLKEILKLCNIVNITDVKSNYWAQVTDKFNIPKDFETIVALKLLDEKTKEKASITKEYLILKDSIDKLKADSATNALGIQLEKAQKYKDLSNKILNITLQISQLESLVITKKPTTLTNSDVPNDIAIMNLIDRYMDKFDINNIGVHFKVWEAIMKEPINFDKINNFNLIPIFVFDKQKELIEKFNVSSKPELVLIEKTMGHWAEFAEYYFANPKYTSQNIGTDYINKMLNYLTKMVIGNGIELMMRRVLLTYLQNANASETINLIDINARISYWLEEDFDGITDGEGKTTSLLAYLYNEICPKLVKNAVELYTDRGEEMGFSAQSIKEILLGFFSFMDVFGLPDEVKLVFNKEITNYFDTMIGKTILLWYVNFENIMKFVINNHRCLKTLLLLS